MASKTVTAKGKTLVQSRIQQYDKGSSFIVEPYGEAGNPKRQVVNKSAKNLALLFELDEDGDHILANALKYIKETEPALFERARENLKVFANQVRKL